MEGNMSERRVLKILLAEDDPTNQYVFRAILSSAGYQIEIVDNGLAAIEKMATFRPDVILLDMMMPVMDGYEAATRLSADADNDGIPILALTAKAMKGDREKTLEAGCDDYLSKPISRAALLERIEFWRARSLDEWMPIRISRRAA